MSSTRARGELLLASLVVAGAFVLLRRYGLLAPSPVWVLPLILIASALVSETVIALPIGSPRLRSHLRLAVGQASVSAVIYATGWGPALGIGYIFIAADNIRDEGSAVAGRAVAWSIVTLAAGEVALGAHVAPNLLDARLAHGLAVLMGLGVALVVRLLYEASRAREQAVAELRASEVRHRALVERATDPVLVLEPNGTIRYASPAITALTGRRAETFLGRELSSLLHPDDRCLLDGVDVPRINHELDARVETERHGWRWSQLTISNHLDDAGIAGIVVNVHDVTERHEFERALDAERARFEAVVQHSADAVVILDSGGAFRYVSPSYERLTGWKVDDLTGAAATELCHPDDLDRLRNAWQRVLREPATFISVESRLRHATGDWRWLAISFSNRLADASVAGVILNVRDVSERKAAEALLTGEATVLAAVGRRAPLDEVLDAIARIVEHHSPGSTCTFDVGGDEHAAYDDEWHVALAGGNGAGLGSLRIRWSETHVAGPRERALVERITALACLAIEHARGVEQLEQQATRDSLTGLPNRAVLLAHLELAVARATVEARLALIELDIDGLKHVNDTFGHTSGDTLLAAIADRLVTEVTDEIEAGALLARVDGDTFVLTLPDIGGANAAMGVAQRLRSSLTSPFDVAGQPIYVSASVGVAVGSRDVAPLELLRRANDALDCAQQRGGNRAEQYSGRTDVEPGARLGLAVRLRRAVEQGRLAVHYQPIVDLASGDIVAAEALARWEDEGRQIPPAVFIPLAEETGLIASIGEQVLATAAGQAAAWGGMPIAVNVSARQLFDASFPHRVASLLHIAGLSPSSLVIELTETVLIEDSDVTASALARMSELGVGIAIDDFGAGYAGLQYLQRYAIREIKIDRSLVERLDERPSRAALVRAVTEMARALGVTVLAEGIERDAERRLLLDLQCRYGQGWLFGRPVPAHEFPTTCPSVIARAVPARAGV